MTKKSRLSAKAIYAAAWIPYGASYYAIFHTQNPRDNLAIVEAIANVLPAALLGILLPSLVKRLPWPSRNSACFAFIHLGACVAFTLTWWAATVTLLSFTYSIARHHKIWVGWGVYAIQWQLFSGVMVYAALTGLLYMLDAQRRASLEQEKRLEAEALGVRIELNALRAQLNPHFLFNTLHSVMALVSSDPVKAEAALLDLSTMLRYALSSDQDYDQQVTLAEEMRFTDAYLRIEQLRLGKRLTVERIFSDDAADQLIPFLTVQPLVENAIKHSIALRPEGGKLFIEAFVEDNTLVVGVQDDGDGGLPDLERASGLGLKSVRRRLELSYPSMASMVVSSNEQDEFRVTLRLPIEEGHL